MHFLYGAGIKLNWFKPTLEGLVIKKVRRGRQFSEKGSVKNRAPPINYKKITHTLYYNFHCPNILVWALIKLFYFLMDRGKGHEVRKKLRNLINQNIFIVIILVVSHSVKILDAKRVVILTALF